MIKSCGLIRTFTQKINKAVNTVAQGYAREDVVDEDDFTSQLVAEIRSELNGWTYDGITFKVRKTTSKGPGSEEAICGADILAVVKVDLFNYKTNKGILIQAKRLDHGSTFDTGQWRILKKQIRKMKIHTMDSYVWLYDSSGVRSIRAHAVAGLKTRRPDDLYVTKCATLLGEFVQSKHGDPRISISDEDLALIPDELLPKHVISISISDNDREHDRAS